MCVCACMWASQVVKNPPANVGDMGSIPGLGRSPGEGFLPGKPHGQRSLACYSPWGHKVGHHLATKQQNKNNCVFYMNWLTLASQGQSFPISLKE